MIIVSICIVFTCFCRWFPICFLSEISSQSLHPLGSSVLKVQDVADDDKPPEKPKAADGAEAADPVAGPQFVGDSKNKPFWKGIRSKMEALIS